MKTRRIAYRITTGFTASVFLTGRAADPRPPLLLARGAVERRRCPP